MRAPMSASLLPLLLASAAAAPPPAAATPLRWAEVIVRSHVVVRIDRTPPAPARPLASMFREKKGPRCLDMDDMAGAAVIAPGSVDFVLRSGRRMRARFGASCPGLDYYSGFYIAPTRDAKLCAGRDAVRDRAGGECPVERIRELETRR